MIDPLSSSEYYLLNRSSSAIERYILEQPVLWLPLSAIEPLHADVPLGFYPALTGAISLAVCTQFHLLCAPIQMYSHATPFSGFAGVSGVTSNTFESMLTNCIRHWAKQGFEKFIIFDTGFSNKAALKKVWHRIVSQKSPVSTVIYSLNDEIVLLAKKTGDVASGSPRQDIILRAIGEHLGLFDAAISNIAQKDLLDDALLSAWAKRGRDPNKLRKISPQGVLSAQAHKISADAAGRFYNDLVNEIYQKAKRFLEQ